MKKVIILIALLTFLLSDQAIGQGQDTTKPAFTRAFVDSLKKANADSIKKYQSQIKELSHRENKSLAVMYPQLSQVVVIAFFVIMIVLIFLFFSHLKRNNTHIGFQSIKLIGLILIFPGICILAIVGGTDVLAGQTLAVLLGTIAGYVLSRDDDKDPRPQAGNPAPKDTEQNNRIRALEEEIKELSKRIPPVKE